MAAFPDRNEILVLWLLCTFMFNPLMCSSKVHCNEKDKSTLLNFKHGVTDPSGVLSSWFVEKDCCLWTGVQCDNVTGRVTELNLPCQTIQPAYYIGDVEKEDKSHCLTGELNISLFDLEFLSHLDLSNNDFKTFRYGYSMHHQTCNHLSSGTPPHRCGNSSSIHYLKLSNNPNLLIDSLHWISSLSSLQYLDLSGIDLHKETNWLQSVAMLPSLSELHLENCQLQNIYPSLQYANFTALKVLGLAANEFVSVLPSWLFNLSCGISDINLSQNNIHGQLPRTLPSLQGIEVLVLGENNLDGPIPAWLCQLEQLQMLDIAHNSFSGPIPTSLGNLSSLVLLGLRSNSLNGSLPESLGQLFNLEDLEVEDNFFTGVVSERLLRSLSKLKILGLGSQALIFDFDPEWIPPFQLQVLIFRYMCPKLPSWIYMQKSLKFLHIGDSRASFKPLGKFWKFAAQLEVLSSTNTSINADMSNVLLNSIFVFLSGNHLRGGVPQVSPNVTFLSLPNNNLSGSISPLLCHKMKGKTNLEVLDIANNLLSGEIPNCWMDWKSLLYVGLGGNNLRGEIPHSMGSLSKLTALNLDSNKLSGEVPLSLKNHKNLRIIGLVNNEFSGAIPSWMGQSIKVILLRSNQFSGNIPTEICQLHHLKILDFSNNSLVGPIPNCWHNLTGMISENDATDQYTFAIQPVSLGLKNHAIKFKLVLRFNLLLLTKGMGLNYLHSVYAIDLSSNNLSGRVPSELFMLTRLQSLNLSRNQFTGMIPQDIGNLAHLESLDLSSNRLSGQIPQSMSGLSFLEVLNISFNNFEGKIPSGTQLQGFTNLSYVGNPKLCGPPLTKICTQDEKPVNPKQMGEDDDDHDKSEVRSCFYMGLGLGFATGLWGVLGVVFFNRRFRHAYFRFMSQLYGMMVEKMDSIYWGIRNCHNNN